MNGRRLFDTSVVTPLLRGAEDVVRRFAEEGTGFVSSTVLGELQYGARKSAGPEESLAQVEDFARAVAVLAVDRGTAGEYGIIKAALRRLGRMIPENDIWIAAIALQHGLAVVTRDAHFAAVPGLRVETW